MKKILELINDYWPLAALIAGLGVLIYLCYTL